MSAAIKLSRTGILMHFGTDEIRLCSPVSLVTQKFLLKDISRSPWLQIVLDFPRREPDLIIESRYK